MAKNKTQAHPKVDAYLQSPKSWLDEMRSLRSILMQSGLSEDFKWGKPCYTFEGANVAIIQGFKQNCALLFTKGALMTDPEGVLEAPGENTQSARRMVFVAVKEVEAKSKLILALVKQAIALEKSGAKVAFKSVEEFDRPQELEQAFADDPAFQEAFMSLTPGRQRGYLLHFAGAKQSKTRLSRIEKSREKIFDGKGMHD